jgi:predicted trehalose synthase
VIPGERVLGLLPAYLARQRWYSGTEAPRDLRVVDERVEIAGWPTLLRLLVDADGAIYQVLVGLRSAQERPEFLRGRDEAVMGEVDSDQGRLLAYDATLDSTLMLAALELVTAGREKADHVRPVAVEQSNSSLVYEDRLILKFFRRIHPGRNLDVEMTEALSDAGFEHVARPLAVWRTTGEVDFDLAVLQPFLWGGTDGWGLALTSLRDLFGVGDTQSVPVIDPDAPPPSVDPADAGGDFSAEARRLGMITAEMHLGLVKAFGEERGDARQWADAIGGQVERVTHPAVDRRRAMRIVEALRHLGDAGPSIRTHGDYHLGQVLRTDAGWYVLDFEGEPARPPAERRQRSSPLRDVAGMLRSLHYASAVAVSERGEDCTDLAQAWEARNRKAFLEGYVRVATRGGILPDPAATEAVLAAFELEKAVYELGYEQAYRPDWEHIPLKALQRLAAG